jgi:hypothetical protein
MGAEVWGTGGEIGYSINGSHAGLIAVPIASLRKGGGMRTVTVRMHTADLSRQMAAMREWLDRHRYEPAGFAFY